MIDVETSVGDPWHFGTEQDPDSLSIFRKFLLEA